MMADLWSLNEDILLPEDLCNFQGLALIKKWIKRFFILPSHIVMEEAKAALFCLRKEMVHGIWYLVMLSGPPENRIKYLLSFRHAFRSEI